MPWKQLASNIYRVGSIYMTGTGKFNRKYLAHNIHVETPRWKYAGAANYQYPELLASSQENEKSMPSLSAAHPNRSKLRAKQPISVLVA